MNNEPHRLCTTCPVIHVENCPLCFGFGLMAETFNGRSVPLTGSATMKNPPLAWKQCPECGGTPEGKKEAV